MVIKIVIFHTHISITFGIDVYSCWLVLLCCTCSEVFMPLIHFLQSQGLSLIFSSVQLVEYGSEEPFYYSKLA